MNTAQTNRVTMFKTVNSFLDQNNAVWRGMPLMVTAVQEFANTIAAIDVAARIQETPTTGATLDKAAARDALEDVMFLTSEALGVLGHNAHDHDLVALTDLRPSTLDHMGVEEVSNRAANLLAAATARTTELATLNVTQANIDELDQALQAFNNAKESPRTATATRMAQTESLSTLLSEASRLLRDQIDRLVTLFRRTNADFVAGYRGARVIVDRVATHKSTLAVGGTPPPANA